VAPIAGALSDKIGERPLMVTGLTLQAAGMGWLALIAEPGMPYSQILAPFIVAGVGVSMAIPAAQNSVVGSLSDDAIGKAAGANSMMRELGGVFGVAIAVAVFASAGSYASPAAFTDGFGPAIGVAAALSLAGAVAGLALPGRRPARAAAPIAPVAAVPVGSESGAPPAWQRGRGSAVAPAPAASFTWSCTPATSRPRVRSTRRCWAGAPSRSRPAPRPTTRSAWAARSTAASSNVGPRVRSGSPTSRWNASAR
jgi:MFS family permease